MLDAPLQLDTPHASLTDFGLGLRWEAGHGPWPLTASSGLPELLHKHGLLLIRGAMLDDDALVQIAQIFGPPNIALPAPFQSPFTPYVRVQSNVPGLGDQSAGFYWHTDGAWSDPPTAVTLLFCEQAPAAGGQTLFVDMRAVHDALPAGLASQIGGLRGRYTCRQVYEQDLMEAGLTDPAKLAELTDLQHPLVRVHPSTGRRALCLHERLLRDIVDLDAHASAALLGQLWAAATDGRYQYQHEWSEGDLLIWDNYAVIHKALSCSPGARKITRRVTV